MLTKPIKSPQVRWVNATVSSLDKDTFKHRAERREGVRGEEGEEGDKEEGGVKKV